MLCLGREIATRRNSLSLTRSRRHGIRYVCRPAGAPFSFSLPTLHGFADARLQGGLNNFAPAALGIWRTGPSPTAEGGCATRSFFEKLVRGGTDVILAAGERILLLTCSPCICYISLWFRLLRGVDGTVGQFRDQRGTGLVYKFRKVRPSMMCLSRQHPSDFKPPTFCKQKRVYSSWPLAFGL